MKNSNILNTIWLDAVIQHCKNNPQDIPILSNVNFMNIYETLKDITIINQHLFDRIKTEIQNRNIYSYHDIIKLAYELTPTQLETIITSENIEKFTEILVKNNYNSTFIIDKIKHVESMQPKFINFTITNNKIEMFNEYISADSVVNAIIIISVEYCKYRNRWCNTTSTPSLCQTRF